MNQTLRRVSVLLFFPVLFQLAVLQYAFVPSVRASPDPALTVRPTSSFISGIDVVPATENYPFDADLATYGDFTRDLTGYYDLLSFTPASGTNFIGALNFHVRFEAIGAVDDTYRMIYYVGVSPSATNTVVLIDWTISGRSLPGTDAYIWWDMPEPNDGKWDWTDIGNLKFRLETVGKKKADGAWLHLHEVWATVSLAPSSAVSVMPDLVSDILLVPGSTFKVSVVVTDVTLLYIFDFKVGYDTTVLTATQINVGPFYALNPLGYFQWINRINDNFNATWGFAQLSVSLPLGTPQGTGLDGNGTLGIITFSVDSTGSSNLHLYDVKFTDGWGVDITSSFSLQDGSFRNTAIPVPEFPLAGAIELAVAGVIVYFWWSKRRRKILVNA